MERHFFVAEDLESLQAVEVALEQQGVPRNQIHAISLSNDAERSDLHLHTVADLTKRDLIRSGLLGAAIGAVAACLTLGIAYMLGLQNSAAGWTPFVFLAIVLFGFCTWEGGFFGIQSSNRQFSRFDEALRSGKHVFFVDVDRSERDLLKKEIAQHPELTKAGHDRGTPRWILLGQRRLTRFLVETMP